MGLRPRSVPRVYDLHRRIAIGGMGEVYEGTAEELGRSVAVKRVLDADTSDENLRLLFLREVAVAATLEHHHVVEVLDAGSQGVELYLVMEYVDGPSLAEVLDALYRQGRLLPVDLACGIVSQVAVGLAHAHERSLPDGTPLGIIHRDVAVENVLIGTDGVPKLVDFGLAKLTGHSLTEPGVVRGRPRTLSPEQARGDKVTARSDIFSLGAVLFELVSGEQLYPNESTASLLFKVAAGEYAPVAPRVPEGTDPDLVRIIQRSLAVTPEDRYGSARQMVRELDAFRAARGLRMSSRALARLIGDLMPSIEDRRGTPHPGELEGSRIVLPADPEGLAVEAPAPDANLRDEVDVSVLRGPASRRPTADLDRQGSEEETIRAPSGSAPPGGSPGLRGAPTPPPRTRHPEPSDGELRPWGMTSDINGPSAPGPRSNPGGGASSPRVIEPGERPASGSLADQLSAPVGMLDSSLPRPRSPARMTGDERAARWWVVYAWTVGALAMASGAVVYLGG
jgi:serine/threonine-protein kinase